MEGAVRSTELVIATKTFLVEPAALGATWRRRGRRRVQMEWRKRWREGRQQEAIVIVIVSPGARGA